MSFYPEPRQNEAATLLEYALAWKKRREKNEEKRKPISDNSVYAAQDMSGVTEDMYPSPIKKLLKGLVEGRKRGLFILLTFFLSLGIKRELIEAHIYEWNKKNNPPLKEGYIKSQIEWHFRQKRKILPPNYNNPSFYKDLGLLDKVPETKNPIVDVTRALKKRASYRADIG